MDKKSTIKKLEFDAFPSFLKELPDPPKELYIRGTLPSEESIFLCVIGSRKYTPYGEAVCKKLISGLKGYDVVIVSGLAIGIDSIAHKSAIDAGLKTIAIPGSGLGWDVLYPKSNIELAHTILEKGGCLISEFDENFKATRWSFPKRNRIMAGMSHAVLVIEAEQRSGTSITARLATEYNRDVLAVPGSIFSPTSAWTNELIRQGAIPVTKAEHILEHFNARKQKEEFHVTKEEQEVLRFMGDGIDKKELIKKLDRPIADIEILLSKMEVRGVIENRLGVFCIKS